MMGDLSIQRAAREDIPRILSIYERARSFMEEQGIIKRLKRMGLKEGDSIRIYGHEFEYLDSEGDDFPASEKEEE